MATPWFTAWCSRRGSGVTARSAARSAPSPSSRSSPASPCRPRERPGQSGTIPYPRSGSRRTLVTSIHIFDPSDGASLPELPPLPIGVLAVGTAELLQQAADLPQPHYITISSTQRVDFQFAPEQASVRAITRWALRFGSVVTSEPHQAKDGPE